ncbi:hypothetical protein KR009_008197 [Drosophila setifemur]|nr:hypothetical protein KR009_008197 [Drosophila setifemur]
MEPRKGKDRDIRTHCNKVLQYWSYDASKNTCTLFIYSGCGGNQNKFFTQEECESFCKD